MEAYGRILLALRAHGTAGWMSDHKGQRTSRDAPARRLSAVDSIERSGRALKLIRASFIQARLAPWRDVRALVDAPGLSQFELRCPAVEFTWPS